MNTGILVNFKSRNQLLSTDGQCTHCGEKMAESMVDRVCNQYKKVQISAFEQNGIFSNSLTIKISNNMIGVAQPGDQIEVIGFVVPGDDSSKKQQYTYLTHIVASNIRKIHQINGVFDLLKNADLFGLSNAHIPQFITEILESEKSPYSTGQSIVSMFLSDWIPDSIFRKMRLSLLLR
jgi:DNA replicative helicase MCM subunit Mcm2 (Cdc46/Mcm family)